MAVVTDEATVDVENLQKSYGELEAVRGVTFDVAPGETFGFLGPNGAGKSTTISMLCTLITPTGGRARVAGCDVTTDPLGVRRRIGLVFQDPTLDEYLTAYENLRFHAELYRMPKDRTADRVKTVIEMVGLWHRRDDLVRTFSGGMKRRLEIARGLLHSPRVLFLDEPTVGLDPQTRVNIWDYIQALRDREAITIFLTTHYMDEAEYCDRIAIIDNGEIVTMETPERAEGGGRQGPDLDAHRRRREGDPRAARALRASRPTSDRRGPDVPGPRRRGVRAAALRRAGRPHPGGEHRPTDPRRCLHEPHRADHPRRRVIDHRASRDQPHGSSEKRTMSTATTTLTSGAVPDVAPVTEHPQGATWLDDLKAAKVVWKREILRFRRNRIRILTSLAQPILFLFVLGTGLGTVIHTPGNFQFTTFMFPGVIAMTILFTAIFSAVSIVWDREFGFLREMLVAPVRRGAIMIGKCAGGATVATMQGLIMLVLAPLVHVPYSFVLIVELVVLMVLTATMLTAFGLFLAARIQEIESFQVVMQLFVLPLFFLAGAVFPIYRLPTWLGTLTRFDPLAYAVDLMRRAVFQAVHAPPAVRAELSPGIHWGSWRLPAGFEIGIVVVVAAALLGGAIYQFTRPE